MFSGCLMMKIINKKQVINLKTLLRKQLEIQMEIYAAIKIKEQETMLLQLIMGSFHKLKRN